MIAPGLAFVSRWVTCLDATRVPLVTSDAVGDVAVVNLPRHGRACHEGNVLGLSGL